MVVSGAWVGGCYSYATGRVVTLSFVGLPAAGCGCTRVTAAAASYELVRFGAVLEVREHAAELEQVEDLAVERALSLAQKAA